MDAKNNGLEIKKKLDELCYSENFIQKSKELGVKLFTAFPHKSHEVEALSRIGFCKNPVDVLVYLKNKTGNSPYNQKWRNGDVGHLIIKDIENFREVSKVIASDLHVENLSIYRKVVSEFTGQLITWYKNAKINKEEGW